MRKAQSKKEFETQKKAYYDKLLENPMPMIPCSGGSLASLGRIVRQVKQPVPDRTIGIYSNISYFEAINRIATDLVFWQGVEKILLNLKWENISSIEYCLGNENEPGHGDFCIHKNNHVDLEGEVFFVSQSFFYEKLRRTIKNPKWENNANLKYVIFNEEAVKDIDRLRRRNSDLEFVPENIV